MSNVQRASAQSRGTVAPWPNFGLVLAQALRKHDACVYGCTGACMGEFDTIAEERIRGDYTTKCQELTVTDIRRDDPMLRLLASPYSSAIR